MILLVEFKLGRQQWMVSSTSPNTRNGVAFRNKSDALTLAGRRVGAHIVVIDPRFARHPSEPDNFIGKDGAETFYKMHVEQLIREGSFTPPSFEDWAATHLDMEIPR